MIRFGLVGTNTSHAGVFAGIFNGSQTAPPSLEGARVVAVWGDTSDGARALGESRHLPEAPALAKAHGIDAVVADPHEMIGQIDAVLVVDDTGLGANHGHLARPFVEAGIPTFIDKPMTLELDEAVALFDLAARRGAPLMSASALRFAHEIADLKARTASIGALSSVVSVGPGDWYNYGVHAVEMYQTLVGHGARWVYRSTAPERDIAIVGYDTRPGVVVETLRDAKYLFHLTTYGAEGRIDCEVADFQAFYTGMMVEVLEMARTGHSPVSRDQTLEVLGVLHAGLRSAELGRPVHLDELFHT
jgi:virulence factor